MTLRITKIIQMSSSTPDDFPDWDSCEAKSYNPGPIHSEPSPKIMNELVEFLKEKGHSCMMIVGRKDHKFKWCMKDVCPSTEVLKTMRKEHEEQEQLVTRLRAEGHTCVSIGERYPIYVGWCQQTPCQKSV